MEPKRVALPLSFVLAAGAAAAASAIWVALSVETGLTYHLFPLLIVLAPVFTMALLGVPVERPRLVALLLGAPAVALGWILLEVSENAPAATFVGGQPGGVIGEVAAFSLLGVWLAPNLLRFFLGRED